MKKITGSILLVGTFFFFFILISASRSPEMSAVILETPLANNPAFELQKKAFDILQTKCNVCHRKQNPFKIFSLKNMNRHGPKIHQQVFIKKRMPKGNEIRLTDVQYQILKTWLHSQNIK